MARPNLPRTVMVERHLAGKIAYERRRRELTYEALARLLTDAGCPIQASAIQKIEKGGRRIVVDEAVAFAMVFDVSLKDFLTPASVQMELEFLKDLDDGPVLRARLDELSEDYKALLMRVQSVLARGNLGEEMEREMHRRLRVEADEQDSPRALFRSDILRDMPTIDIVRRYFEEHIGERGDGKFPDLDEDGNDIPESGVD